MTLLFEADGERHAIAIEGEDLPELIQNARAYFSEHHAESTSAREFPVKLIDAMLNALASDQEDVYVELTG